jgi:hypothetical protein
MGREPLRYTLQKGLTVFTRWVREDAVLTARRGRWMPAMLVSFLVWVVVAPVHAQDPPPVTVGAGLQTSFLHHRPAEGDPVDNFRLNSLRFYVNGQASDNISLMVSTDINYGGTLFVCPEDGSCGAGFGNQGNEVQVLDAVAQIAISDKFNIWFGRHLPPSDRANLHGPFYSHHWAVFSDSLQDGYPFLFQGRQNGATYWGQFGKVKLSAGAYDGSSTGVGNSSTNLMTAGRIQVDFWDPEAGYYLNGTYYGQRNLLAIGLAAQTQAGDVVPAVIGTDGTVIDDLTTKTASSFDFLLERMTGNGSAVSLEAEVVRYDGLGGYPTVPGSAYQTLTGGFLLAAYLFPEMSGPGQFEILAKYGLATFSQDRNAAYPDFDQKTSEVNFNYILNEFNARVMVFFKKTDYTAVRMDDTQIGVGLQIQI